MTRILFDFREKYRRSPETQEDIKHILRLRIKSMSATSGPPIGPVLGQYAIPISKFCTDYNDRSIIFKPGVFVFVTLFSYVDGSYSFDLAPPISSLCLIRAAGIKRGARQPGQSSYAPLDVFVFYEAMLYQLGTRGGFGNYSALATARKWIGTAYSSGIALTQSRNLIRVSYDERRRFEMYFSALSALVSRRALFTTFVSTRPELRIRRARYVNR